MSTTKTILLWNAPQRIETLIFGSGRDTFQKHGCPVTDCEIFNSQHQYPEKPLDSYDAIIFNFNDEYILNRWPKFERKANQRFVFLTQEAPPSLEDYNIKHLKDYFNWTMSYRRDSDVPLLYGRVVPKSVISKPTRPVNKRQLLTAMISHCDTHGRREEYVRELKEYLKLDVYGNCDSLNAKSMRICNRDEVVSSAPECYRRLETKYKFYLSFENAICPDYVTEKFFNILQSDMIPIVYGGADYSSIAPQKSYIDARNFTPKELAAYLLKLDSNDTLYNEFFKWKEIYTAEAGVQSMARHAFCELCRKLHQELEFKTYPDLSYQWNSKICLRPRIKKKQLNNPNHQRNNATFSVKDVLSNAFS